MAELHEPPEWVDVEDGGWVMLGLAQDKERAEKALADWFAELEANAPPQPQPEALVLA